MAYVVGEHLEQTFVLADANGVGIVGAVFTSPASRDPTGATISYTLTEVGGGLYRVVTAVTTAAGHHALALVYAGPPVQTFQVTWDVDTAAASVSVAAVVGGTTLLALRRRLAYRLGDIILATGTSAGTTSVFYDAATLTRADNAYRSWEAYVASASVAGNVGVRRNVQGSTQIGGAITVNPALSAGVFSTGDVVELHGNAGTGWTVAEKHAALNEAIAQAATGGGVEAVATAASVFDRDSPTVTVPNQLKFVQVVEWQGTDDEWHVVPQAKGRGKPGWYPDKPNGTVTIQGGSRYDADGAAIRFWGHGDHVALSADADTTLVNPIFVVAWAGYQLLSGSGMDRCPDKALRLMPELRREYERWARAATKIRPSSSLAVRGY